MMRERGADGFCAAAAKKAKLVPKTPRSRPATPRAPPTPLAKPPPPPAAFRAGRPPAGPPPVAPDTDTDSDSEDDELSAAEVRAQWLWQEAVESQGKAVKTAVEGQGKAVRRQWKCQGRAVDRQWEVKERQRKGSRRRECGRSEHCFLALHRPTAFSAKADPRGRRCSQIQDRLKKGSSMICEAKELDDDGDLREAIKQVPVKSTEKRK